MAKLLTRWQQPFSVTLNRTLRPRRPRSPAVIVFVPVEVLFDFIHAEQRARISTAVVAPVAWVRKQVAGSSSGSRSVGVGGAEDADAAGGDFEHGEGGTEKAWTRLEQNLRRGALVFVVSAPFR